MNFYKRHLGDIAKACAHLSQGAMGAYDLLLDWLYANEKPLPLHAEALHRIGRASSKPERANVDLVIAEFFDRTDTGYVQKRVTEEIAKANAQADTNRRIAEEREARKRAAIEARIQHEACNESLDESYTKRQPSQTPDSRLQTRARTEKKKQPQAALPDCPPFADPEAWAGFIAMRTKERHPLTPRAARLIIAKLAKTPNEATAMLDQSTRNGWRDVFDLKPNGADHVRPRLSAVERVQAANRAAEERERLAGEG